MTERYLQITVHAGIADPTIAHVTIRLTTPARGHIDRYIELPVRDYNGHRRLQNLAASVRESLRDVWDAAQLYQVSQCVPSCLWPRLPLYPSTIQCTQ